MFKKLWKKCKSERSSSNVFMTNTIRTGDRMLRRERKKWSIKSEKKSCRPTGFIPILNPHNAPKSIKYTFGREEKIKHKKRMRKLENLYRHNLRRMRKTLEVKLERSASVLEEQREERKKRITEYVSCSSTEMHLN